MEGRGIDELHRLAVLTDDREGRKGSGIAAGAEKQAAAQHHAAADEIAEVEIAVVAEVLAPAQQEFRGTGRGRVVAEMDRPVEEPPDLGCQVEFLPGRKHILRRADLLGPVPQLEGRGDPEACDPEPLCGGKIAQEFVHRRLDEDHEVLRGGELVGLVNGPPDIAGEIEKDQVARAPAHLEADREGAIGVELEGHQRLAHLAALRRAPPQQAIGLELADDDGHRLGRQTGEPCHFRLGQPAVQPHQRQHQALIIKANAALRGAARIGGTGVASTAAGLVPCHGDRISGGLQLTFPAGI